MNTIILAPTGDPEPVAPEAPVVVNPQGLLEMLPPNTLVGMHPGDWVFYNARLAQVREVDSRGTPTLIDTHGAFSALISRRIDPLDALENAMWATGAATYVPVCGTSCFPVTPRAIQHSNLVILMLQTLQCVSLLLTRHIPTLALNMNQIEHYLLQLWATGMLLTNDSIDEMETFYREIVQSVRIRVNSPTTFHIQGVSIYSTIHRDLED